jgi:hypothetical protein
VEQRSTQEEASYLFVVSGDIKMNNVEFWIDAFPYLNISAVIATFTICSMFVVLVNVLLFI